MSSFLLEIKDEADFKKQCTKHAIWLNYIGFLFQQILGFLIVHVGVPASNLFKLHCSYHLFCSQQSFTTAAEEVQNIQASVQYYKVRELF